MRILFIYKNSENLGIEYLSSVLKSHGHVTDLLWDPSTDDFGFNILDRFNGFNLEVIDQKIRRFQPNLIAFSITSNLFQWAAQIAKFIKNRFQLPIIMGGPHSTIIPEYIIQKKFVDFVIQGEGEIPFTKLVECLEGAGNLTDVPNLWYKENLQVYHNPLGPLIQDLDELPLPDKDLFWKFGAFRDRYYIMTTRGCPHECTYCMNHQLHAIYPCEPFVRWRSVKNVIEELLWAKNRYHIKSIFFYDDNFFLNEKWLVEFARAYLQDKINLPFKILVHPDSVNELKIHLVKAMGCIDIDMGIESGSPRIRKNIFNRLVTNDQIINSARIIKSARINLSTLNIINSPTEIPMDMIQTLKLNRLIHPEGMHISTLYPYPNTKIEQTCIDEGIMTEHQKWMVNEGLANYHQKSLINHPYKELGERIRLFGPLFVNARQSCFKDFLLLPPLKWLDLLQLFFSTSKTNARIKVQEFLTKFLITRKYYRKKMYLS